MSIPGARRPRTNRSKSDIETCSNHSYGTAQFDLACPDCRVTCTKCTQRLPASNFYPAKPAKQSEILTIGLWKASCKRCQHGQRQTTGTLLHRLRPTLLGRD